MSPYVTLGAADTDVAHAFYDAVLTTIGWSAHASFPDWRGYSAGGSGEGLTLWICKPLDGAPATAGNGTMMAFGARTRDEVDAFHAVAMAHGAQDEGAPGHREHYGPDWYAAYLRDPTGNKLAIVHNG